MDRLKAALVEIRAIRDCEAVHNLLLDCWLVGVERGEEEALRHADMLRRCIAEYVAARAVTRPRFPEAHT